MSAKRWTLKIGGHSAAELREALAEAGIALNPLAEQLLAWDGLGLSPEVQEISLEATTVQALGLPNGGTMPAILAVAATQKLAPCAPAVGPYLRLHFLDQVEVPETTAPQAPGAPAGSLTIATADLGQADDFPRGFYLRRIDGTLWLRGYRADDLHVWDAEDHFVFRRNP